MSPDQPQPQPQPRADRAARIATVVAGVAAVLVLALAVAAPLVVRVLHLRDDPPADLSAVQRFEDIPRTHTRNEVGYPVTPPAGGPHDPRWLDCGVYDRPVRDENAVHALEHGTTWITYDPALAEGDVDALAAALPDKGILSPYPGLPAPVVVTVWGAQLRLTGPDDPRLPLFLERFGDSHTAPEPFASCAGGVRRFADDGDQGGGTAA